MPRPDFSRFSDQQLKHGTDVLELLSRTDESGWHSLLVHVIEEQIYLNLVAMGELDATTPAGAMEHTRLRGENMAWSKMLSPLGVVTGAVNAEMEIRERRAAAEARAMNHAANR